MTPMTPQPAPAPPAREQRAAVRGRAGRRPSPPVPPRPLGPAGGAPTGPAGRRPQRTPRDDVGREDAHLLDLARQFAAAYLEIESGRRGARQLRAVGWGRTLVPPAATRVTAPGRVVSVAGARTLPERFDAVALVRRGERFGALAIRLADHAGTWVVDDAGCPEVVRHMVRQV